MYPDAAYFSILLCLTPDDFTRQVESAATQWVNGHSGPLWKWSLSTYSLGSLTVHSFTVNIYMCIVCLVWSNVVGM
jgi:hypothetical protein